MESKNRNLWIIIAMILVVLCCCAVVVFAAAVGWFTAQPWFAAQPWDLGSVGSYQQDRIEQTFNVSSAPNLEIDNFAGNVTVRAGESGVIRVVATKRAPRRSDLERIRVQMSEQDGGLVIKTERPSTLSNVTVNLEISTPVDTDLDVHSGAGNMSICCLSGDVSVDTGAGNIDTNDLTGWINTHSGAGNIDYQGAPQGDCRFEVGAGNIDLRLPADLSMEVDVETGVGNVDVGFPVDGQVTRRSVQGTIGNGDQGKIYAHTGAGNIDLIRR